MSSPWKRKHLHHQETFYRISERRTRWTTKDEKKKNSFFVDWISRWNLFHRKNESKDLFGRCLMFQGQNESANRLNWISVTFTKQKGRQRRFIATLRTPLTALLQIDWSLHLFSLRWWAEQQCFSRMITRRVFSWNNSQPDCFQGFID